MEETKQIIPPTVGRKVWYYPGGSQSQAAGDQPCSADVVYVHSDRMVNLGFRHHNGVANSATHIQLVQPGDPAPFGPFCCWMPYQISHAKAAK